MGSIAERLAEVISASKGKEFVRGEWDCTTFCFEVLRPESLSLIKGKYKTRKGALALISSLGGFEPTIEKLGGKEISLKRLRTGDLCKIISSKINEGGKGDRYDQTIGIFNAGSVLCVQKVGMVKYPKSFIEKAWRFD